MVRPGTASDPLRVAIIGSGPAAFYAADRLLADSDVVVAVDMFDRLPTPFGLVRAGVAPDHPKMKSVTRFFEKVASRPRFRFFGGVDFGAHLSLDELRRHYHQIVFATGAQTDRRLEIPGEDLGRSHPATEFVAWYNGHPDYRHLEFDLSQESVAVVGVGNVAVDVARILCRTPEELAATDIADYALEALSRSRVRDVYMLGRRGPAQAAFSNSELKEIGELESTDVVVRPEEAILDPRSEAEISRTGDSLTRKKVEILQEYAVREPRGKPRRLHIRFLVSPVELVGDERGNVVRMRLAHNELVANETGSFSARPTGEVEDLDVGLVFRSVGYRGVALPGVSFNERWGVVHNVDGRVVDPETREPVVGLYVTGWIKRGPSGLIGTNKPDAVETVGCMLEDAAAGRTLQPEEPDAAAAERLVRERQPDVFTYDDWRRLDELEIERGRPHGRPRVKYTSAEEMLDALGRLSRKGEPSEGD
jgi:ferredoxin--NADP+ reductase